MTNRIWQNFLASNIHRGINKVAAQKSSSILDVWTPRYLACLPLNWGLNQSRTLPEVFKRLTPTPPLPSSSAFLLITSTSRSSTATATRPALTDFFITFLSLFIFDGVLLPPGRSDSTREFWDALGVLRCSKCVGSLGLESGWCTTWVSVSGWKQS